MDHAVSLVQAYLQLNGYFTAAESPIFTGAGRKGARTITDIDVLAFRFPSGTPSPRRRRGMNTLDMNDIDAGLGIPADAIDMVIGEVKEGRVSVNSAVRDPEVLRAIVSRFGGTVDYEAVVHELIETGTARIPPSYSVRLVLFGAFPPGSEVPPCRIISLGHVLEFLQKYVHRHWQTLRHLQFKHPAFGFLLTLEKARRGGAGRRGAHGVEIVPAPHRQK